MKSVPNAEAELRTVLLLDQASIIGQIKQPIYRGRLLLGRRQLIL